MPRSRSAVIVTETISWNYTTWLNIAAIAASPLLLWRFTRTGGPEMLRMMNGSPDRHRHH